MTDAAILADIRARIASLAAWLAREPDADEVTTVLGVVSMQGRIPQERVNAVYLSSITMHGAG